ncbi:MAG: hypothetical protein R2746_03340 [Acidimicrobiales bacterium]
MSGPWVGGPPPPAGTGGRPSILTLSWLLGAGPIVWIVHLSGSAALVPLACEHPWATSVINAFTVACAALIGWAGAWSARVLARHRPEGPNPDEVIAVLATLALLFNVISLLVTVLEGAPVLVLDACPV